MTGAEGWGRAPEKRRKLCWIRVMVKLAAGAFPRLLLVLARWWQHLSEPSQKDQARAVVPLGGRGTPPDESYRGVEGKRIVRA